MQTIQTIWGSYFVEEADTSGRELRCKLSERSTHPVETFDESQTPQGVGNMLTRYAYWRPTTVLPC